jgi:ABC-type multidrug transport system ATPase subunit
MISGLLGSAEGQASLFGQAFRAHAAAAARVSFVAQDPPAVPGLQRR